MIRYSFTIFLSAFLLFQLQPLIGKRILPWFGGSPAVWTTCLLFFQVVLLSGYVYAYLIAGWKNPRKQCIIHLILLVGTILLMPIVPDEAWKPIGSGLPTWRILGLLTMTVGGPYFLLSTTSPLLQSWFSTTHLGRSPYRLYAISNAGSLLGLVSYPFVVEPMLSRLTQALTWSGAYVTFVLACGFCAWKLMGTVPNKSSRSHSLSEQHLYSALHVESAVRNPVSRDSINYSRDKSIENPIQYKTLNMSTIISWLLMATCGSALLLSFTNQICQNVAAVPFLWVLPLSLYLATFIIAFEGRDWYRRVWCMPLFAISSATICILLHIEDGFQLHFQLLIYSAALFAGCMVCHGELARIKPTPRYITQFYLTIASGGALGGIFVGLASPVLFPNYWEFHISVGGVGALSLIVLFFDSPSKLYHGKYPKTFFLLLLAYLGLITGLVSAAYNEEAGSVAGARSFHGVLHISEFEDEEKGLYREMYHGSVLHGMQYTENPLRHKPTSYYGSGTGGWLAVKLHPRHISRKPMHIGIIGLGTGTMASLGRKDDVMRFYEINPDVIHMSNKWFWYLNDTSAYLEIVEGDARIQLERELTQGREQQFDVLVADAFSSDSIPIHLLTLECAKVYRRHLKDDGILAVHISNKYLDLIPVAFGLADVLGWQAVVIDSDAIEDEGIEAATWVLITENQAFLDSPYIREAQIIWTKDMISPTYWTDDYASLIHVMIF